MRETVESLLEAAKRQGVPPKAAYSVRQAAKIVGFGRDHLYRLVHSGKLRAVRVGKVLYIPTAELARLLSGLEAPEREEPPEGRGQ